MDYDLSVEMSTIEQWKPVQGNVQLIFQNPDASLNPQAYCC